MSIVGERRTFGDDDAFSAAEGAVEQTNETSTGAADELAAAAAAVEANAEAATPAFETWDELDLQPNLLRGIFAYGFEKPSFIQQRAIKPIMDGKDVLAQAQSGTGKTATFSIGALSRIDLSKSFTQVLVLSPTRELSVQTEAVIKGIGCFMTGLRIKSVFGGTSMDDVSSFSNKNTPHIICGCPGRVSDMIRRGRLNHATIKLIVLDEADEMLSSGFKDQVSQIFLSLSETTQVALFSATLPEATMSIVNKIMPDPVRICMKREQLTLEGIRQYYVAMEDDQQKYETLKDLFSAIAISQCIIYCNSVRRVQDLFEAMRDDGFPVCCIHSGMEKVDRDRSFTDFKQGKSRVLISSNVTARGIDIQQVSIVINFDLPKCVHTYLHRIGRSGRWGRKGVGINFVTCRDTAQLRRIETHYTTQISELPADISGLI